MLFDVLQADQQIVPWSLTLHYRGIPEDQITRCLGLESIRFYYINSLKEAMYLRTNSSKEIMNMAKDQENKLVESIISSIVFKILLFSGFSNILVNKLKAN